MADEAGLEDDQTKACFLCALRRKHDILSETSAAKRAAYGSTSYPISIHTIKAGPLLLALQLNKKQVLILQAADEKKT